MDREANYIKEKAKWLDEHDKEIYNQALEDFSKKMKEANLTNSFVLYYGDEIDLEEFMNLASEEIKEQLMK